MALNQYLRHNYSNCYAGKGKQIPLANPQKSRDVKRLSVFPVRICPMGLIRDRVGFMMLVKACHNFHLDQGTKRSDKIPKTINPKTLHIRNRSLDRKSTRLNSSHVKISYAV